MMDQPGDMLRRPVSLADWLELGDRLGPRQRELLLSVIEREERKLAASRENLARAERMMAEGLALLGKVRALRAEAALSPQDRRRMDAVILTIEETQRLIATRYAELCREWLHGAPVPDAAPPDDTETADGA